MKRISLALVTLIILFIASCHAPVRSKTWTNPGAENRYKSVVRIIVSCPNGYYLGSGVATGPREIYTAKHVVLCGVTDDTVADVADVRLWNKSSHKAYVAAISEDSDLARLYVDNALDNYLEVSYVLPKIGDTVCYMGGSSPLYAILTKCGEVFSVDKDTGIFWSAIYTFPGNSGGPMLDMYGRVIGITSWRYNSYEPTNGATSSRFFP